MPGIGSVTETDFGIEQGIQKCKIILGVRFQIKTLYAVQSVFDTMWQ